MRVFINTLSKFHSNPENEELGKETWEKYCFDIASVYEFNEGTDGYTTIGLKNGNRWTIAILYSDFLELIKPYFDLKNVMNSKAEYEYKEQV